MRYKIIDCDQHVIEAPDLWEKALPAKFQSQAPKLVKDEDGGDAWLLGDAIEPLGLVAAHEVRPRDLKWTGVRYADMHPGITDAKARLELMDEDGISAAVFFPPQRTMIYFMTVKDRDFHLAGMEGYNRWISDWVSHCPERLGCIWQVPATGVEDAVAMAKKAKEAGAVGLGLATWPSGKAELSRTDDPFFALAEDLGLPVHVHVGLVPPNYKPPKMKISARRGGPEQLVGFASTMSRMPVLIAETVFKGLFVRFPKLKFVGSEVGTGWVPYLLQEIDDRYRRNRYWCEVNLEMLPSEYYQQNWLVGFVQDQFGVQNCDAVGVETMMWSSDFPHHINDWPNSRYLIDSMAQGLDAAKKRKIFCENAGKLYGFL